MKIVTWNVNGIRAIDKKNELAPFLKKIKPDIACFQETKAMQHESPIDLPEYDEFWNSAERKGYSGTAIFSKQKPISVTFGFSDKINKKYKLKDTFGDTTKEGRVISAEYKDFYLVNVYTPNAKRDLERLKFRHKKWDPAFLEHCKDLEKKKPLIICGDFNVAHKEEDLARPKDNEFSAGFTKEEREGADKLIEAGFVDTFRMFTKGSGHYTWWTYMSNARARNIGWRIDYFFVSKKLKTKVKSVKIHDKVMGSDHCPVVIELK